MGDSEVLTRMTVILASIQCCKKIIVTLDGDADSLNELLSDFKPVDMFNNPKLELDRLQQYLLLVHNFDWYAASWSQPGARPLSGLRPEHAESVYGAEGKRDQVADYIDHIERRTVHFLRHGTDQVGQNQETWLFPPRQDPCLAKPAPPRASDISSR